MTITLVDVVVLLGLFIDGAPLTNLNVPADYIKSCESLLGLVPLSEHKWANKMIVATQHR